MKLIKTTTMAILFSGLLLCVTASANNEQGELTSEDIGKMCFILAKGAEGTDERNQAIELCLKAEKAGSLKAQETLIVLYMHINPKEAVKWARKAVDNGSIFAQRALGVFYLEGLGVEKDRQQAKKWLTKACNNKHQSACDILKKHNLN